MDQDRKISFPKSFKEFDVDFSFSQRLHVLHTKLEHARFILENTLNTIASLKIHANKVAFTVSLSTTIAVSLQCELDNTTSEMKNHLLTTCKLLRLSKDIRQMVVSPTFSKPMH